MCTFVCACVCVCDYMSLCVCLSAYFFVIQTLYFFVCECAQMCMSVCVRQIATIGRLKGESWILPQSGPCRFNGTLWQCFQHFKNRKMCPLQAKGLIVNPGLLSMLRFAQLLQIIWSTYWCAAQCALQVRTAPILLTSKAKSSNNRG